ncbi:MAG TPA: sensor histidine kinase, partial [Vicinamibacteria bacterium]
SAPAVAVREPLPFTLRQGWEAADGDPEEGVRGLDGLAWRPADPRRDPGPPGGIRWLRLQLDFEALRGQPLALSVGGIRDVDEAFLDGVHIGAMGSFPPALRAAAIQPRVYPLPTDLVNRPGPHLLALRIYHSPSSSPVFRFDATLERLTLTRHRAYLDQTLTASAALFLSLALALLLLPRDPASAGPSRAFARVAGLVALYLVSGHSGWSELPLPATVPFRLRAATGALICASYGAACLQALGGPGPRRFRAYFAAFVLYAAAALALPDVGVLVVPTAMVRALGLVVLVDLCLLTGRALRAGRPAARPLLGAHLVLALGLAMDVRPAWTAWRAAPALPVAVAAGGFAILGIRQLRARFAAVQHERSRISRDLHDTVAQNLVGISIRLDAALDALEPSAQDAREHLERARDQVRLSLDESRRAVWRIRAEAQIGRDLAAALTHLGQDLTVGTGVKLRVETRGEPLALSRAVESNLFRIGQEALTNVVRHARAREVRVELRYEPGAVRLRVRDDGRGLRADGAQDPGRHFGLRGMQERAEELGGRLEVNSIRGLGTEIAVTVPVGAT